MKQLEKSFIGRGQVKGFMFTQIKQNKYGYIYRIEADTLTHYEVFMHKPNTRFKCVSYPSNNAFGIWAWTYRDLERAEAKFDEITNKGEVLNG